MNTFWLKIAGLAVVAVGVLVLVSVFSSQTEPEPQPEPKTFYDVAAEDDRRLRAEPQFEEPPETNQPAQPSIETVSQTRPVAPPKPEFKKLSEIEEIQARRLFEMAITERKMGRLPGVRLGYKKMVDHCREIIQKWPDSEYAFKAKRMLADIPQRYHKMYNITKEEIDLGNLR